MRNPKKINKFVSLFIAFTCMLLIGIMCFCLHKEEPVFLWLLSVNFLYLAFKVFLSIFYKPAVGVAPNEMTITAILPCYNENPDNLKKAIASLEKQTHPVDELIFVDDGSTSLDCWKYMGEYGHTSFQVTIHRFEKNRGKREALAWAISHARGELLLMMDSDGELKKNAVEELCKPFSNEKTGSVCGRIMVKNHKSSFLTHMQEVLYFNSFEVGRAAQSLFQDVIVASGALSMHRKAIFTESGVIPKFLKSNFWGIQCISGDDRMMTDLSREKGYATVYQNTALCYTLVPETFTAYCRQQIRWIRSALVYSLVSLKHAWKKPMYLLFQILESYLWLGNLVTFLILVFTKGYP